MRHGINRAKSVRINLDPAERIAQLPGIGPVLSSRVVAHRKRFGFFLSAEDLAQVRGIGERHAAALEEHVSWQAPSPMEFTKVNLVHRALLVPWLAMGVWRINGAILPSLSNSLRALPLGADWAPLSIGEDLCWLVALLSLSLLMAIEVSYVFPWNRTLVPHRRRIALPLLALGLGAGGLATMTAIVYHTTYVAPRAYDYFTLTYGLQRLSISVAITAALAFAFLVLYHHEIAPLKPREATARLRLACKRARSRIDFAILAGALAAILGGVIGGWMQAYTWHSFDHRRAAIEDRRRWTTIALEWADHGRVGTLRNADLQSVDLTGVDLGAAPDDPSRIADLRHADLRYAQLRYANLQGADLSYADLEGALLQNANLQGANLYAATLTSAQLSHANLRDAELSYANLQLSSMWEAQLQGASLEGASVQYAFLDGANLDFTQWPSADLTGATLARVSLRGANLQYADLTDASLAAALTDPWTVLPEGYESIVRKTPEDTPAWP